MKITAKDRIARATINALEGFKHLLDYHNINYSVGTNEHKQLAVLESNLISDFYDVLNYSNRPVEIDLSEPLDQDSKGKKAHGIFHRFVESRDPHNTDNYALIELEDGQLNYYRINKVRFTDKD